MTSEEEERPRFITGSYGRHKHQWVNAATNLTNTIMTVSKIINTSTVLYYQLKVFTFHWPRNKLTMEMTIKKFKVLLATCEVIVSLEENNVLDCES